MKSAMSRERLFQQFVLSTLVFSAERDTEKPLEIFSGVLGI